MYVNYRTIGYNSKIVAEKDVPKQWEDLLDAKWKGKISLEEEDYVWYGALVKYWGKEKTQKYMRALAKQDIQWRKGHTLISQLMAAGEFPLGVIYAHRIEEMPTIQFRRQTEIVALKKKGHMERVLWRDGTGAVARDILRHVFLMTGAEASTDWVNGRLGARRERPRQDRTGPDLT